MSNFYSNTISIELDVQDEYGADVYALVSRPIVVEDATVVNLVKNYKNSEFVHMLGTIPSGNVLTHITGNIQGNVFDMDTQTIDDLRANIDYRTYVIAINSYKKTSSLFSTVGKINYRDPPVLKVQVTSFSDFVVTVNVNIISDIPFKYKLVLVERFDGIPSNAFLNQIPFTEINHATYSTEFNTQYVYDPRMIGKYTEVTKTQFYDLLYVLQNADPNGEHIATRVSKVEVVNQLFSPKKLIITNKSFDTLDYNDNEYSLTGTFTVPEVYTDVEYYIVIFKEKLPLNFENNGIILKQYNTHSPQIIATPVTSLVTTFNVSKTFTRINEHVVSSIDPNVEHYAYLCLRDTITNERSRVYELVMNMVNHTEIQPVVNMDITRTEADTNVNTHFINTSNVDIYVTAVTEHVLLSESDNDILLYMTGHETLANVSYGQIMVYPNPYSVQVYQGIPSKSHHIVVHVSTGLYEFDPPVASFVVGHSYYFENNNVDYPLVFGDNHSESFLFKDKEYFILTNLSTPLYAFCTNPDHIDIDVGNSVNGSDGIPVIPATHLISSIEYYTGNIHDPLEYIELTHNSERVFVVMAVIDENNRHSFLNTSLIPVKDLVEIPIVPIVNVFSHYTRFEIRLDASYYVFLTNYEIPLDSSGMIKQIYVDFIINSVTPAQNTDITFVYNDLTFQYTSNIEPNESYKLYAFSYNSSTKQKYFNVLDVTSTPTVSMLIEPVDFLGQVPNYITYTGETRKMRRAFNGIYQGESELHEWVAGNGHNSLWGWVDLGKSHTITGLKIWQNNQLPASLINRTIHDFKLHFTDEYDQTYQKSNVHTIHFSEDISNIDWKFANANGNLQSTNGQLGGQNDNTYVIDNISSIAGYHFFQFDQFSHYSLTGRYVYFEGFPEKANIDSPRLFEMQIYGFKQ